MMRGRPRKTPECKINRAKVYDMRPTLKEKLLDRITELEHDIALWSLKVKTLEEERKRLCNRLLTEFGEQPPLPEFTSKHFEEEGYTFDD